LIPGFPVTCRLVREVADVRGQSEKMRDEHGFRREFGM
jgi:hypothetical protein